MTRGFSASRFFHNLPLNGKLMSKKENEAQETIPGAKKLSTGALVPIGTTNRHILKRPDMVPVELVRSKNEDGSDGPYVEAAGSNVTQAVILSGSLALIARSIRENQHQLSNLVDAALRIEGGEDYLVSEGLLEAEDANVVDENATSALGEGSDSETKAADADAKAAAKVEQKKKEAEARNKKAAADKKAADAKAAADKKAADDKAAADKKAAENDKASEEI